MYSFSVKEKQTKSFTGDWVLSRRLMQLASYKRKKNPTI